MHVSIHYGCITIWIYCIAGTNHTTIQPKQDEGSLSVLPATAKSRQKQHTGTPAYDFTVVDTSRSNDSYGTQKPLPNNTCILLQNGEFVICGSHHYCCGKGVLERKCCPKLPSGAIFGIVSSATIISIFTVCCLVACCTWCDICPYRRARLAAKKTRKQSDFNNPSKTQGAEYAVEDETGKFCEEKNHGHVNYAKPDSCNEDTEKINSQPDQQEENDHVLMEIPLDNESLL